MNQERPLGQGAEERREATDRTQWKGLKRALVFTGVSLVVTVGASAAFASVPAELFPLWIPLVLAIYGGFICLVIGLMRTAIILLLRPAPRLTGISLIPPVGFGAALIATVGVAKGQWAAACCLLRIPLLLGFISSLIGLTRTAVTHLLSTAPGKDRR